MCSRVLGFFNFVLPPRRDGIPSETNGEAADLETTLNSL